MTLNTTSVKYSPVEKDLSDDYSFLLSGETIEHCTFPTPRIGCSIRIIVAACIFLVFNAVIFAVLIKFAPIEVVFVVPFLGYWPEAVCLVVFCYPYKKYLLVTNYRVIVMQKYYKRIWLDYAFHSCIQDVKLQANNTIVVKTIHHTDRVSELADGDEGRDIFPVNISNIPDASNVYDIIQNKISLPAKPKITRKIKFEDIATNTISELSKPFANLLERYSTSSAYDSVKWIHIPSIISIWKGQLIFLSALFWPPACAWIYLLAWYFIPVMIASFVVIGFMVLWYNGSLRKTIICTDNSILLFGTGWGTSTMGNSLWHNMAPITISPHCIGAIHVSKVGREGKGTLKINDQNSCPVSDLAVIEEYICDKLQSASTAATA